METKPKLTNAQSRERAIEAHRLPEGTIGRQYQIVLPALAMEWFLSLSSRERGAIVFDAYETTQEEYDPDFDDDDE